MPRDFIFFFIFGYFVLFVDRFEILSHHPSADCPHWFREEVQRIIYKVFSEELMIWIASTFSSVTFLLNFWVLPVSVVVLIINNLLYGLIDEKQLANKLIIYRIYWLPLNANEFNGVDNTCFLENFVLLMYLIIYDDFLKLY